MQTVLITGGAGFIGSHLVERLLRDGLCVRVLDNLDPFYDVAKKQRNLEMLRAVASSCGGASRFECLLGDLRDA